MSKQDFAVIFDMDGVLIDTVRFHWQAMNLVLAKHNIHIEDDQLRNYIGQSVVHQLNQISVKFNTPLDVDAIVEELKPIKEELQKGIQPKEGVVQLLELLRENNVPIAIGTSSTTVDTDRKLSDAGILGFFDVLVTLDDVTKHKPDPAVYLMAAEKLKVQPSHCVVLEDAPSGILAAKRANMICIAVQTPFTITNDLEDADTVVASLASVDMSFICKLMSHA